MDRLRRIVGIILALRNVGLGGVDNVLQMGEATIASWLMKLAKGHNRNA